MKINKYLPSVIFCCFIGFAMILFLFLPKSGYSVNEKRYLKSMPNLSATSVFDGSFEMDFENYISDNFQYREFFVGCSSYYDFISGRNGENGIYKGADEYLISAPLKNNYEKLRLNINKINEFVNNNNLKATLMVIPSTGYIMEDKCPSLHLKYSDKEFIGFIEQMKRNIDFIDLNKTFEQVKNTDQVFYKTDHHWTSSGAFDAYKAYCNLSNIKNLEKSDFDINTFDGFCGTTYSKSAYWLNSPDKIEIWNNKKFNNISMLIDDGNNQIKKSDSLFFMDHLNNLDKYPIYLDGNHGFVKITNPEADGGKLLVVRDSFGNCLAPFLSSHYSEIYMVDTRQYKKSVSEIVKENDINSILFIYGMENMVNETNLTLLK